MKIKIKRWDKNLPLPSYEKLAAGFDFVCREGTTFKPKELKSIPSNCAIELPAGYCLLILSRSSTPKRFGLMMPNAAGVIDPFFNGDDNEIMLQFYNFTDHDVVVKKGDKIAQGLLLKYETAEFEEVEKLRKATRKWGDKRLRNTRFPAA